MVIRKILIDGESGVSENFMHSHFSRLVCSTISHELGTSVAVIDSNIQLFKKFSYGLEPALKNESLNLCEEAVKDVSRLFQNIQLLDSIQKSRICLEKSKLHLKELIRQLYPELRLINLDHKRIEKKLDLKDEVIYCDYQVLYKIIFNLVSNALKFSRNRVQLNMVSADHLLSVTVEDRGIGIPQSQLDLVFQPFYRASNVGNIPGVGLGLAIVLALVKKLEGSLSLSSEVGEGTTFQLMIPYETEIAWRI